MKRYKTANDYMIFRKVKAVLKDCERGIISRETAASFLRTYADELEAYDNTEQMTFEQLEDLQTRIQAHVNAPASVRTSTWRAKANRGSNPS